MKPEHIKPTDEDDYIFAVCKCPGPLDYRIKFKRIKDGLPHVHRCICEECGTEVIIIQKETEIA